MKDIMREVSTEYYGPNAPDRFNHPKYSYCQKNGILYRNFEADEIMKKQDEIAQGKLQQSKLDKSKQ
jgi:hypothetical protein